MEVDNDHVKLIFQGALPKIIRGNLLELNIVNNEATRQPHQRTLTYFIRGSITVRVSSCLTGKDSAVLLMLNLIEIFKPKTVRQEVSNTVMLRPTN